MPYTMSRARVNFENELKRLKNLSKTISFKNIPIGYDHKIMVFQASIFLLCACLEDYVKVIIEDWIYELKSKSACVKNLPIETRTLALLHFQSEAYKKFLNTNDEKSALNSLKVNQDFYKLMDENFNFSYHIKPEQILNKKKYPSIRNIEALFNRVGINSIFSKINSLGKKDYKLSLKSFLDVRETMAHQGTINITYNDIKRHFENINKLVFLIDKILYSHFVKISGAKYWPY
jgi:hypothetical protein